MQPVSHETLGVTIAYILPGFLALWGLSFLSPVVHSWLDVSSRASPTVGGFLFVLLASLGLGVFLNFFRNLVIDPLQHRTGIKKHRWSYALLQENIDAIQFIVLHQFRYYQCAGNTGLALVVFCGAYVSTSSSWSWWYVPGFFAAELVLWLGARKSLRTYHIRLEELLGPSLDRALRSA